MAVPFIDLRRFETDFLDRWAETCRRLSANTQFVGGPEVKACETELAEHCGTAHAVGCANGTDALQLALRAVGVGAGDKILVPDATFWATFEAVVNCGARPVTVDIDPTDLQMDFELFRQAVEEHKPRAAILVHLYGWGSARIDDFRSFCNSEGLPLLEDGAQAFGVEWNGRPLLANALVSTLSFYPAKVLGACGDAGAVLTNDAELAERVRILGNHGRTGHYEHGLVGWNSRLGGFEAAYLRLGLEHMPERLATRRRAAERYRQHLGGDLPTIAPPEGYLENGYLNVTLVDPEKRPALEAHLKEHGIGFGIVYPGAMSDQPGATDFLAGAVHADDSSHGARHLARSVLNLPLFAHITDAEVDEVLQVLRSAPGFELP